jgi:hypothetical protein
MFPPAMVIMSPPPAGYTTNSGPSPYTVPQNGFQSANPASANAYGAAAAAAAELVRKRAVASAEISRDGRWMGLVGDDGNLKLIDLESERCARRRARRQPQAAADAERPSLQIVGPACLVLWRAHRAGFFARLALPPVCWPGRPDHRPVAARPARRRPLRGPLLVRLGPRMGSRAVRRPQGTLSLCERRRGRQAAPLGLRACWATSAEGRTSCASSRRRRRRRRYCSASCNSRSLALRRQGHHSTRSFSHQLRRHSGATSLHDAPGTDGSPEEDGPTLHPPPLSHDVALVQPVVVSRFTD